MSIAATGAGGVFSHSESIDADTLSHMILAATAPLTGAQFFQGLAQRLAETMGVEGVLISECLERPQHHVRTLAYWERGGFQENIRFDVRDTPCQDVIDDAKFCFHPAGMLEKFPEWSRREGNIESFIGMPLFASSDQRVIGHIAVFDQHPMDRAARLEPVFRVFASRASAELERLQSERVARSHLRQLAHVARHRTMSQLAGALIHEISQPLTALSVYAKILSNRLGDTGEVAELAAKLERESQRSNDLISRLKGFLRDHELQRQSLQIQELIEPVLGLLEQDFDDAGVRVEVFGLGDSPGLSGDGILLQQALFNLVKNAFDAVQTQNHSEQRWIRIQLNHDKDALDIVVADSGPGVPDHVRPGLFTPLNSGKDGGMGIGLALSRSIALEHGGDLRLLDASQHTSFQLSLPLSP